MTERNIKITIGELAAFLVTMEKTKNPATYKGAIEKIEDLKEGNSPWHRKILLSNNATLEIKYGSYGLSPSDVTILGVCKDDENDSWDMTEERIWVRNNLPESVVIQQLNTINEKAKNNPSQVREFIGLPVMQDRKIMEARRFSGGILYTLDECKIIDWDDYKTKNI